MVTLELFIIVGGFFGYRHEYSSVIDKLINGIPLTGFIPEMGKILIALISHFPWVGHYHPLGGGTFIFEPTVSQLLMNSFPYLGHHNVHF